MNMPLYAQWKAQLEGFTKQREAVETLVPIVEIWRAFDPVVPVLFEALRQELAKTDGPSKKAADALAKFERDKTSAPELGETLHALARQYRRVQTINTAFEREKTRAEKEHPMLAGGAPQAG